MAWDDSFAHHFEQVTTGCAEVRGGNVRIDEEFRRRRRRRDGNGSG
jgi:hypothetical protein